ncbi:hypothetical protein I5L34_02660 [Pseudomonas aeruginosa]|uniref:hypothetical protein n=1 Tax=Pseudomonas aeruginosa TaxID=287 RepID=UPI001067FC56|nr:hypothetical protein [Pseudomonas aeruginosa]MBH9455418.1 hypothetical protein [Pseudomonas aeruginosa]MBH9462185.1 hypothetical protein [Pseudomonas aeruginosa]TEB98819.1 hypothetical protein IPC1598_34245 [Pseudomonas aeruginosa]
MSNELTDVRCPCGAEFQADSYDAGFIAGSGMCQNCDAALPPKDICTCPSGDGSLVHPCPAHPAPVEQAGGDERAAFEAWWQSAEVLKCKRDVAMEAWQARAALAQPSQAPTEGFTHFPELLESVQQMDAMLKANSAQAEAERPEVVAWRYGFSGGIVSDKACLDEWKSGGEYQSLMTVAQHERIVKAWIERWKAYIELSAKIAAQRDAANARLHEVATACATAEQERDNAEHWADQLAKAIAERFGVDIGEHSNLNCPWNEALVWMQQPPAQAQHSVPEGYALIPVRETEAMHDAVMALLYKGVARTDTQKLLDAYIAAAPGKEGV